jgi:hypothetical protein
MLGLTSLFYVVIMTIWGLWRYFRKQGVDSSYRGSLVIAEILLAAQAAMGLFLVLTRHPQQFMHILYGVVSLLVVPGIFAYTKGEDDRRAMLLYGVGFLFLVGILLRALTTGS